MSSTDLIMGAAGSSTAALPDPNFENVSLLLSGNGTNGAQNNTFIDSSTNNFTITRNGNTTQGSFSPYGSNWSVAFNGSVKSWLAVPASSTTTLGSGNFTIEAWVNVSESGDHVIVEQAVIDEGVGNNAGWLFFVTGGQVKFGGAAGENYITTSVSSIVGKWTHVALVRSGTNAFTIYVNGVASGTTSTAVNMNSALDVRSNTPLVIGAHEMQSSGAFFSGNISNLRIVKSAVYTSNFTPTTTPLTAISNTVLLTFQANRIFDASGNNLQLNNTFSSYSSTRPSVSKFSPFEPTASYDTSVIGGSGYITGSGLTAPNNSAFAFATGDFCIECWYKSDSAPSPFQQIVGSEWFGTSPNGKWIVHITTTGVIYIEGTVSGISTNLISSSATSAADGGWHHIAFTRSGTTVRAFVDGTIVQTSTSGYDFQMPNSSLLYIGQYYNPGDGSRIYGNGYISNLRLVKGNAVYTTAFTPSTTPLTAIANTSLLLSCTNAGIPDLAMQNNLQTVGNAQVSTSVKKYGTGSISIAGSGNYLSTVYKPTMGFNTGDFTIESWVYPIDAGRAADINKIGTIISSGYTNSTPSNIAYSFWFWIKSGVIETINLDDTNGSVIQVTGLSISINAWHHFAVVRQSGTVYLYIDGISRGSVSYTGSLTGANAVYIGQNFYGGSYSNWMQGYIDDLRITNGYCRYPSGTTFTPPAQALPNQ